MELKRDNDKITRTSRRAKVKKYKRFKGTKKFVEKKKKFDSRLLRNERTRGNRMINNLM